MSPLLQALFEPRELAGYIYFNQIEVPLYRLNGNSMLKRLFPINSAMPMNHLDFVDRVLNPYLVLAFYSICETGMHFLFQYRGVPFSGRIIEIENLFMTSNEYCNLLVNTTTEISTFRRRMKTIHNWQKEGF
jgi:hypothetical protein